MRRVGCHQGIIGLVAGCAVGAKTSDANIGIILYVPVMAGVSALVGCRHRTAVIAMGAGTRVVRCTTDAPFVFSIAGISASLAALAGLVAGLRRGQGLSGLDLFRLREIVEFAFVNVLLALAIIPLATMAGLELTIWVAGVVTFSYLILYGLFLDRRRRQTGIATYRSWLVLVLAVVIPALAFAAIAAATGTVWALEIMLLFLLARPMAAFLLVLSTFGAPPQD